MEHDTDGVLKLLKTLEVGQHKTRGLSPEALERLAVKMIGYALGRSSAAQEAPDRALLEEATKITREGIYVTDLQDGFLVGQSAIERERIEDQQGRQRE